VLAARAGAGAARQGAIKRLPSRTVYKRREWVDEGSGHRSGDLTYRKFRFVVCVFSVFWFLRPEDERPRRLPARHLCAYRGIDIVRVSEPRPAF